jgi:hypothetical protein
MLIRNLVNGVQERVRSPRFRRILNSAVAATRPSPPQFPTALDRNFAELQAQGYTFLPNAGGQFDLDGFRAQLAALPCKDAWRPELGTFSLADVPAQTNNAQIVGVSSLPIAHALANQEAVIALAGKYLRCMPTIDDVMAWWTIPGRPAPFEEQFFHRDNDAVGFIKLFVYLSDVTPEEGAHVYVPGSQADTNLLGRRVRYTDEDVAKVYPLERHVRMSGGIGTMFLEDTYGLHRGAVPETKPRLVFQVRYTTYPSNFARKRPVTIGTGAEGYINRFVAAEG